MADLNNITFACESPGTTVGVVGEERSQTIGPYQELWTVMKDPEGNGFCVS